MNGKTLTAEQCSKLSLYILMTTKTREGEAEPWAKDIISYRCFAPGRCKGRVVGVKRFDPYIPAWCPKLKKNGGMKQ